MYSASVRLSVWSVSGVCCWSGKEGKSDLVRWGGRNEIVRCQIGIGQ